MGWTTWKNERSFVSWNGWSSCQRKYVQANWLRDVQTKKVYE